MRVSYNRYTSIHEWLRRNYGKASKCEHRKCAGVSQKFEWALLSGKSHSKNRKSYKQFCKSCHAKYDYKYKNVGHIHDLKSVALRHPVYLKLQKRAEVNGRTISEELIHLVVTNCK